MKTKLTRVHLALDIDDVGVQFEATDDDGGTSTQRGFVTVGDRAKAAVWAEVQKALDAEVATMPLDLPAADVARAMRQKRDAQAALDAINAEIAAKKAELAALSAQKAG